MAGIDKQVQKKTKLLSGQRSEFLTRNQAQEAGKRFLASAELKPCLYNPQHPDFSNDDIVEQAWKAVVQECALQQDSASEEQQVIAAQQLWAAHRKSFTKERSRRLTAKNQQGGWSLYKYMSFADRFTATRSVLKNKNKDKFSTDFIKSEVDLTDHDCDGQSQVALCEKSNHQQQHFKENIDCSNLAGGSTPLDHYSNICEMQEPMKLDIQDSRSTIEDLMATKEEHDKQLKLERQREEKVLKRERLQLARCQAEKRMRQTVATHLEDQHQLEKQNVVDLQQNENNESDQRVNNASDPKVNKAFSDYCVAMLDQVKDERARRSVLKDITNILFDD